MSAADATARGRDAGVALTARCVRLFGAPVSVVYGRGETFYMEFASRCARATLSAQAGADGRTRYHARATWTGTDAEAWAEVCADLAPAESTR